MVVSILSVTPALNSSLDCILYQEYEFRLFINMDSIFLGETELPVVILANERYRFRSDLFVSKPHFTSKKPNSRKIDYEEELLELVKSSRFINFAAESITSEDSSKIPSSEISSNSFLESTEKEFRKQPIFSLDKVTTRIDYPDFLVNRLINTSKDSDVKLEVKNQSFLLPKNSSFIICDIKESAKIIDSDGKGFL